MVILVIVVAIVLLAVSLSSSVHNIYREAYESDYPRQILS